MPPPDAFGHFPWSGSVTAWICLVAGVALLVVAFSERFWGPVEDAERAGGCVESPATSNRTPSRLVLPGRSGLRLVGVEQCRDAVVVDAIVDHGRGFGRAGLPITLRLQVDNEGRFDAELQRWAAADAVVETVVLAPAGPGRPQVAELRHGASVLRLSLIDVRS
jgi:hypothetical protein